MLGSTTFMTTFQAVCARREAWFVGVEGWTKDAPTRGLADDDRTGGPALRAHPIAASAWRRALLCVASPAIELVIWLTLFGVGTRFLVRSATSKSDLILNAVALCFIQDIDELVCTAYVAERHRFGLRKRRVGVRFGVREGENGVNTDYFRNLNWQTRLLFGPAVYFKFSATILCA